MLAHLDRLAGETGHWPKLAASTSPRWRRSKIRAARSRCCCASPASTRRRPARSRRPSPRTASAMTAETENKTALVALDRLYSRAQQWEELAEVVRREVKIAPHRRGSIVALTFRLAQIFELALVDMPKAVEAYRDILTADPAHAETRAALERMFMGGTLQLEIADVLEPLYRRARSGRSCTRSTRCSWAADRRRRAPGAAAPAGRDRRAEAGRSGRGVRLVGSRRQGGSGLGAGARRAAAPGPRRPTSGTRTSPPCSEAAWAIARPASGATCCCGWPPCFENDLGDLERAEKVLVQVLAEHEQDPAGARVARPHLRRRRGCTRTWPRSCASASPSPTTPRSWFAAPAPRAGLCRGARRDRRRDRQLPGGAGAGVALA